MFGQHFADAAGCLWVFCHHVEVASTAGTWQFVAETEVVDLLAQIRNDGRFGACVECLVLLPGFADESSVLLEIAQLDGIEQVGGMLFHLLQQVEVFG